MKHLSRISLVKGESVLSNEEMKKIVGKGTYRCCCGMGMVPCFPVIADSEREALLALGETCYRMGYVGGGCFLS